MSLSPVEDVVSSRQHGSRQGHVAGCVGPRHGGELGEASVWGSVRQGGDGEPGLDALYTAPNVHGSVAINRSGLVATLQFSCLNPPNKS